MFMWLNSSGSHRVDRPELLLLDDVAIKVYEFVLWRPWWVLKKTPKSTSRESASQQRVDFKMLQTPPC